MKQFILFTAFIFYYQLGFIHAQNPNFAPVGAYWNFKFEDAFGPGRTTLKVVADTVVNGKTYRNLYQQDFYTYSTLRNFKHFGMLDLRNDSVFLISRQNNVRFLYTFKAAVGDTLFVSNTPTSQTFAVADSVKTENILGMNRRVVYYTKYCKRSTTLKTFKVILLVENIGLINEIMDWGDFSCGILETRNYQQTCYQGGNLIYPTNPTFCSPNVSTNDLTNAQISISPNPTNSDLTINFPSEMHLNSVELMNYLGQKVETKKGENLRKINVSNLPNGAYFVRLVFDNQGITKKIMVQH